VQRAGWPLISVGAVSLRLAQGGGEGAQQIARRCEGYYSFCCEARHGIQHTSSA